MSDKELEIFENEQFGKVRWVKREGEPWFVALDIAENLGYTNPSRSIQDHCNYAELFKPTESVGLDIPSRGLLIIPESDVYALIFRSNLPKAVEFRKWVCEEVLPSIRKTGKYAMPNAGQNGKPALTTKEKAEFLEKILNIAREQGCYRALVVNELILHDTGCDLLEESGQNIISVLGKPEYTPKQIAKILGRSANSIDDALVRMGLQVYGLNQYNLTEKGLKYGCVYDVNRRRSLKYPFQHISNIKWYPVIVDKLRMHFQLDTAKALEQGGDSHLQMPHHTTTGAQ